MVNRQHLTLEQKNVQRLSQAQLRYVRMLEMTAPEFEEAVMDEVEANPALETDEESPERKTSEKETNPFLAADIAHSSSPWNSGSIPDESGESLYDYLNRQLRQTDLSPEMMKIADYIIGNIDGNGYLSRPLQSIGDDLLFRENIGVSHHTLERVLSAIRQLDPPGIAASSLQECLILQLERQPESQTRNDALSILKEYFEPFSMKHYHKIISGLRLSDTRLKAAVGKIRSLNPKPGSGFSRTEGDNIAPDFILENEGGRLYISMPNRIPELSVRKSFADAVNSPKKTTSDPNREFIASRYNEAKEFLGVIRRRQDTLFRVMTAILKLQKNYFETEDENNLRPMALKDVAAEAGIDIPTASRATNNKYLSTPWGLFPLRYFFSERFSQEGESVSGREIEARVKKMIEQEDKRHPLSDDAIASALRGQGYEVSRRTVNKYRDRLRIPVARLRKSLV